MVHVSERAMQQVLMAVESSRGRGCALPDAKTPFTVICARAAGMRRLYTPCGWPSFSPGGFATITGSPRSYHVRVMWSSRDSMYSVQKDSVSPDFQKSASMIGMSPAYWSPMDACTPS